MSVKMYSVIKWILKVLGYTKYHSLVLFFNRMSCQSCKILLCIVNFKEGIPVWNASQSYWTPESLLRSTSKGFSSVKCLLGNTSVAHNTDKKYHNIHLLTLNKLWGFTTSLSWCLMDSAVSLCFNLSRTDSKNKH